jgi:hypothetical protein
VVPRYFVGEFAVSVSRQEINEGYKASGLGCPTHWPWCPSIVGSIWATFTSQTPIKKMPFSAKKDEGALILWKVPCSNPISCPAVYYVRYCFYRMDLLTSCPTLNLFSPSRPTWGIASRRADGTSLAGWRLLHNSVDLSQCVILEARLETCRVTTARVVNETMAAWLLAFVYLRYVGEQRRHMRQWLHWFGGGVLERSFRLTETAGYSAWFSLTMFISAIFYGQTVLVLAKYGVTDET